MSRDRFLQILCALHVSDHTDEPTTDKNAKLRPMVEHLNLMFKNSWLLHQQVSFDESSPGSSHRTHLIKRSMNKKVPSALQHWALCDSVTGYCYHFEALWDPQPSSHVHEPADVQRLSSTLRAVYRSLGTIKRDDSRYHSVYADNLFMHPALVALVRKHLGHYMTGTWRCNYMMPKFLKMKKLSSTLTSQLAAARAKPILGGVCHEATLVGVSFCDANAVSFLTNDDRSFKKMRGGTKQKVKLGLRHSYNKYMNGVDRPDQQTEGTFSTNLTSRKWWKRPVFWMLDLTLANCFIIYKFGAARRPDRSVLYEEIAMGLFAMGRPPVSPATLGEKRKATTRLKVLHSLQTRLLGGPHLATPLDKYTDCQMCKLNGEKRKKTKMRCSTCMVCLCLLCFAPYHQG